MAFQDVFRAIAIGVCLLVVLAAAAFGLVVWSVGSADHQAIARAIAEAPGQDRGVPVLEPRVLDFKEGYFPDCAGLAILLKEDSWEHAVDAAVRADVILPQPDRTICEELASALNNREAVSWFTYARYWHGALVVHRLVLSVADYATLKMVATGLVGLGLFAFAAALSAVFSWRVALAALIPIVVLSDVVAVGGLPMLAVSVTALLLCGAGFVVFGARRTGTGALVAAGLAGAIYNFWDFFCNPAVLAAICAWAWLMAGQARSEARGWLSSLFVFAAVLGGYIGFWAAKWAIALIYDVSGGDVYILNAGEVTRWSAPLVQSWYPGGATVSILAQTADAPWKIVMLVLMVGGVAAIGRQMLLARSFWLLLLPVGAALLVLEVMAGHTIAHSAITFRLVPVALGLAAASALVLARQTMPAWRKPAISSAE